MVIFSGRFGQRIKEILRDTGLTPNSVEVLSEKRISHMTVRRMGQGQVPSSDHISEFADAVGRARDWEPRERAQVADELLELAEKRVRYHVPASVRYGQVADLRPVAACPTAA